MPTIHRDVLSNGLMGLKTQALILKWGTEKLDSRLHKSFHTWVYGDQGLWHRHVSTFSSKFFF